MMTPTGVVQPEDAKYIKRRLKSGSIDVHPTETALIVNYEVEAIILGEYEKPVLSDKKECQKVIRLKSLNKNSDCAALAKEVVNKCSLIHPSKVGDVEHLIYFLQSRKENAFSDGALNMGSSNGYESLQTSSTNICEGEKPTFSNLDQYVELLYEEMNDKVKGSMLLMRLSRDHNNLEELARNVGVISALARVLREDYKRSLDLSTNIVSTFHAFSIYSQFHYLISQYKVGSLCIGILEFELQRFNQWRSELVLNRGREVVSRLPVPKSARPASQGISGDRRRSSTPSPAPPSAAEKKRLSLIPAPKTAISNPRSPVTPGTPGTPDEESSQKKFASMVARQDRLLKVCFSLLLNIAENVKVEDKIRKRNVVAMLVQCLERSSVPLLCTVSKFLMKLSVRVENKDEMANLNVIEKLPKLLQMNSFELEKNTLGLLFNFSFDVKLRDKMIRVGFLQKLVSLLNDGKHLDIVLKVLYHLSMDERAKPMFIFTDCLVKMMKMMCTTEPDTEEYETLVALCINIACNSRCAESMASDECMGEIQKKAINSQEGLLMKFIRNLTLHENTKQSFLNMVEELIETLVNCQNAEFVLECVAVAANLPLHEINICHYIEKFQLISWINANLAAGKIEDDLSLEIIMFIGAMAADEGAAKMFSKADIVSTLIEVLKRKQEEDELVLQIIYVFYQITRHNCTRQYLVKETEVVAYLIDLMNDKNVEIKRVCDLTLEIIKEEDPECEDRVKMEKFQWHNSHWLAMVDNKSLETSLASLPDYNEALPQYDLLDQSIVLHRANSFASVATTDDIEIISNNPNSDEGSRPLSRYDSEAEDYSEVMTKKNFDNNDEVVQNALRNMIITDDDPNSHHFFHIESPSTAFG